jgi:glycosyltransferase involved in cell wall biosynthesis
MLNVAYLAGRTHVVIVKCFSAADVVFASRAKAAGAQVIFDLCDNIFVPGYGKPPLTPAEALRQMLPHLAAIIVPTESLARVVTSHLGSAVDVRVVPDGLETPSLLRRERELVKRNLPAARPALWERLRSLWQRAGAKPAAIADIARDAKVLLWFGNHGSPWSTFGIADIKIFRSALERIATEFQVMLVVVSNNAARYEAEIRPMAVPSIYVEWQADTMHTLLSRADVVIAPSGVDAFAACKSPNRTVMALAAGVPVIATRTPALEPLRHCVWLDDPFDGLRAYLTDKALVERQLEQAKRDIERLYAPSVVGRAWMQVLRVEAK